MTARCVFGVRYTRDYGDMPDRLSPQWSIISKPAHKNTPTERPHSGTQIQTSAGRASRAVAVPHPTSGAARPAHWPIAPVSRSQGISSGCGTHPSAIFPTAAWTMACAECRRSAGVFRSSRRAASRPASSQSTAPGSRRSDRKRSEREGCQAPSARSADVHPGACIRPGMLR
jgi:hypothetical protein